MQHCRRHYDHGKIPFMSTQLISHFRFLPLVALLLMSAPLRAAEPADSPLDMVTGAAESLQQRLDGRKDYYTVNASELYALVDELLLPRFDTLYAGKLVLGKQHWTAANEQQRERFIETFYNFLVRTYAKGILEFDQDKLTVLPDVRYSKDRAKAMVRTNLVISSGENVQVNYSVRRVPDGWKIYDVRIDGVSYIQNYRNQFDAEINAKGIDSVISRLEDEALKAEATSLAVPAEST
jgi:phospholipid transport system substrate-binding protein